jgi:hypothetical protein
MYRKICWIVCIVCLVNLLPIWGVQAQESKGTKITIENVDQLVQRHDIRLKVKGVDEVVFTPDSKTLLINSASSLLRFDMLTGKAMKPLAIEVTALRDMAVSADGAMLAYVSTTCKPGNCTSKVILLDLETGKVSHTFAVAGFSDGLGLSTDGSLLAYSDNKTETIYQGNQIGTALGPSTIHIVDVKTGKEQRRIAEQDSVLGHLFISPDGTQLAYNSMEWKTMGGGLGSGKFHYVELSSGKELRVLSTGYLVTTISPDWTVGFVSPSVEMPGFITFSSSSPHLIGLKKGTTLGSLTAVQAIGFNPDSTLYAATGVVGGGISFHRVDNQKLLAQFPIKTAKYVYRPQFSPDGSLMTCLYKATDDTFYLTVWGIGTASKN